MHIGGLAGGELLGLSEAGQLQGGTVPGLGWGNGRARERFLPTACLKAEATLYPLYTAHNYLLLAQLYVPMGFHSHWDITCLQSLATRTSGDGPGIGSIKYDQVPLVQG